MGERIKMDGTSQSMGGPADRSSRGCQWLDGSGW